MLSQREFKLITVAVTGVTAAAPYSIADIVGTVTEIPFATKAGNEPAKLVSLAMIEDDTVNASATDIFLFSSLPVPTSADNVAASWPLADALNLLGVAKILATDYGASAINAIGVASGGLPLHIHSSIPAASKIASKSIWAVLVTRGTPTYTAGSLSLKVGIEY